MEVKKIEEILKFYYLATSLKTKIRKGWISWNIKSDRLESVAEHIYGTCVLAISIDSQMRTNVDLSKVIIMLVLHELEEIVIGDITPFDKKQVDQETGRRAAKFILGDLLKADEYDALLQEFNERKTLEAKFAYICDKLEFNLQAKRYYENGTLILDHNVSPDILNNPAIQDVINNSSSNVLDIFIEYDRPKFKGTQYEEIVDRVKVFTLARLDKASE